MDLDRALANVVSDELVAIEFMIKDIKYFVSIFTLPARLFYFCKYLVLILLSLSSVNISGILG